MLIGNHLLCVFLMFHTGKLASAENIPCNARKVSSGYICVCNSSYCDTVDQPTLLPRGSYYHYSTSENSPGLSMSSGKFVYTTQNSPFINDVVIEVNSSVQYQTFEGVGAALSASSAIAISRLPPAAKSKLIESFFGPSGVQFSFLRVPLEPSDFTPRYISHDDVPGDIDLKYFNLTEYDFLFKIPVIKMAMNVSSRTIKLLGVAWTPPQWMKTNNGLSAAYIRNKYLGVWANYILKFLQAYRKCGLEFWGITEGNQIMIYWFLKFVLPSFIMPPLQARYFTKKYLGPLLKTSGFENVKIFAMEDQRPFVMWYFDVMCADKDTEQHLDGAAIHWYFDDEVNVQLLEEFHQKYPNKIILYTESSINYFLGFKPMGFCSGDWMRAVIYINNIFQNLSHWVGSYFVWNLALDETGGPAGFLNNTMDAQTIINTTTGEFYRQPVHYVLGHLSKFIMPGAKIIYTKVYDGVSETENDEYLNTENINSFGKPVNDPLPTKKPFNISTSVLALAAINPDGSHAVIAYNPHPHQVNLIVTESGVGVINQTVEANSLNTLVYW